MSDQSTNLQLPFLASGQAQKHVTVNESLLRLDALVQLSIRSATTTAQPASPVDGDVYVLRSGKSGVAWASMSDGALAYYRDAKHYRTVLDGGTYYFQALNDAKNVANAVFTVTRSSATPTGLSVGCPLLPIASASASGQINSYG